MGPHQNLAHHHAPQHILRKFMILLAGRHFQFMLRLCRITACMAGILALSSEKHLLVRYLMQMNAPLVTGQFSRF